MVIFDTVLLRVRNVSEKFVENFGFNNCFPKIVPNMS